MKFLLLLFILVGCGQTSYKHPTINNLYFNWTETKYKVECLDDREFTIPKSSMPDSDLLKNALKLCGGHY